MFMLREKEEVADLAGTAPLEETTLQFPRIRIAGTAEIADGERHDQI